MCLSVWRTDGGGGGVFVAGDRGRGRGSTPVCLHVEFEPENPEEFFWTCKKLSV